MNSWSASAKRYNTMPFARCGRSGLFLPRLSLGLWHNFGGALPTDVQRAMLCRAFDLGVTHFDLANNYGPPPGSAEENFGRILRDTLAPYRNELILSTKAGYRMWPGPYGEWGSRKYLLSSLDESLRRMRLEYVDIFYSHRPDPDTPLEETMGALAHAVRSGKALYVGISNYPTELTAAAARILRQERVPLLIHQPRYNLFDRWVENGLLDTLEKAGAGCIAYSPLAQGMLAGRYLAGIPHDARAAFPSGFLSEKEVQEKADVVRRLAAIANQGNRTLPELALQWVLRDPRVTSVLTGASSPAQIEQNVAAVCASPLDECELEAIEAALKSEQP